MADDFKHIIRVANTDLDGSKPIYHALTKIKGVSVMFANMLCKLAGIDIQKKAGTLLDAEVNKLNEIIKDPAAHGAPSWMLNRRKDYETGLDKHLVQADLQFSKESDIRRLKKIKSYRGVRHQAGLPLRGQRTKSNFRKNKGRGSLGVQRKKK
ncbi:30S ribosomal protein S13 [Candidatus Woesearchaeota archaeon]|nr:MAG: 30S ribosomal protein S13 [Candidatus Woesearchaeota archaeon]